MYYRIGSIEQEKEGGNKINIVREFHQYEYNIYTETSKYLGLHLKNKHLYQLIIRNGEELERYLRDIKGEKDSEKPDHIIFEANRLLMNYLSMLKTYDDHISSALTKTYSVEVKNDFKSFLSKMYDEFFMYRFIIRLRNFAQHFDIPISSFTSDYNDNYVMMNRDQLLNFEGWSTVKKEIQSMEKNMPVEGLADSMNSIMRNVYLLVMQMYAREIIKACEWISLLQAEFSGKATIIAAATSHQEFKLGNFEFIPMNSQLFIDAVEDLNELPNVNLNTIN